jgi:non-canonical (house-cleaning) NTP pyrophosphatase
MVRRVLSESDVLIIFEAVKDGEAQVLLAADFGVSQQVVSEIMTGKSWGHVTGQVLKTSPRCKLTIEDVMAIDKAIAQGISNRAIAADYVVSEQAISNIRCGRNWSEVTGRLPKRRRADQRG